MSYKNILKRYFLILASLASFWACKYDLSEDNTLAEREILSILYDSLAKNIPPPPPNLEGMNEKDSLRILIQFNSIRDSLRSEKQVVGLTPYMHPLESKLDITQFNPDHKELIRRLNSLKEKRLLNMAELRTLKRDSIVKFEEQHLREFSADFFQIDKLISFSRISFNDAENEAAVVATVGTSRLASFTAIYFFRKVNQNWILVDSKGLSMS